VRFQNRLKRNCRDSRECFHSRSFVQFSLLFNFQGSSASQRSLFLVDSLYIISQSIPFVKRFLKLFSKFLFLLFIRETQFCVFSCDFDIIPQSFLFVNSFSENNYKKHRFSQKSQKNKGVRSADPLYL